MHGATIKTITWCFGQMSAVWHLDRQCSDFITVNAWNGGSELCLRASLQLHIKLMNGDIFHTTRRDDWLHTSSWSRAPWRIRRIASHNTGLWITMRWEATGWDAMSHNAGVSSFCRWRILIWRHFDEVCIGALWMLYCCLLEGILKKEAATGWP